MKWYFMRGPGGMIACKGDYKAKAVTEAAERWGCDPAEIEATKTEPYNGNGAHCAPLQKKDAAADGKDP